MKMIHVNPADRAYATDWLHMRSALWPDEALADLGRDIELFFSGHARHLQAVLFAHDTAGHLVGFAELNIRPYAEGCVTDRVAFLEGWYVEAQYRNQGAGAALIEASEQWARANNCTDVCVRRLVR